MIPSNYYFNKAFASEFHTQHVFSSLEKKRCFFCIEVFTEMCKKDYLVYKVFPKLYNVKT